jgi:hypothetical protein
MGLFRCLNSKCLKEFEAAEAMPVCPGCGLDPKLPRYTAYMERLCTIHFDPPDSLVSGLGQHAILCDGRDIHQLKKGERFTGEPCAVTCPKCLAHAAFPKDDDDAQSRVPAWTVSEKFKEVKVESLK